MYFLYKWNDDSKHEWNAPFKKIDFSSDTVLQTTTLHVRDIGKKKPSIYCLFNQTYHLNGSFIQKLIATIKLHIFTHLHMCLSLHTEFQPHFFYLLPQHHKPVDNRHSSTKGSFYLNLGLSMYFLNCLTLFKVCSANSREGSTMRAFGALGRNFVCDTCALP